MGCGSHLDPKCLNVVCAIRSPSEVSQVELDLIPPVIQTHWHGADEGLHSGCGLVVAGSKPPADILVIKHLRVGQLVNACQHIYRPDSAYLDFKCEVLLHVLYDHDQEW